MLTPEVLVGAILNYLSQPESSRKLTSEQLEWFRDPEMYLGCSQSCSVCLIILPMK